VVEVEDSTVATVANVELVVQVVVAKELLVVLAEALETQVAVAVVA
jgi:hypothetical protein